MRLGDARADVLHVHDLGLGEPALERVVVESCRSWSDGAPWDFGLSSLPGAIGIGDAPLATFEHQRRGCALVSGFQHPGVEQDYAAVEAAAHPAVLGGRVSLNDARDAQCAERSLQVVGLGQRITQRLAAKPDRRIGRKNPLRLHFQKGLRLCLGPLCGHGGGAIVESGGPHHLQFFLEARPRLHVRREIGMHALVRAFETELRHHR